MESQECKIPKWKREQNEVKKQSFDDAFESLGTRLEFHIERKKKVKAKKAVGEKVNS